MASLFPDTNDLQARLDFDLIDNDGGRDLTPVAQTALDDLSEDALFYGDSTWTAATVPGVVKAQILRAAARFMKNGDGFTQSRAGDETVEWAIDNSGMAGSAHFSDAEIEIIKMAKQPLKVSGFGSMGTYAWSKKPAAPCAGPTYTAVNVGGDPALWPDNDPGYWLGW